MYTIRKSFSFAASHQLLGLAKEHPCTRLHGHNYMVTVELQSENLNEIGFVKDYRALDPIKKFINERLDHRHLNDVLNPTNPTAENIAFYLFQNFKESFPQITAVEVQETDKTMARYEESKS